MKYSFAFLIMALSFSALSEDLSFKLPAESPLILSNTPDDGWLVFKGDVVITGVYQFRYEYDSPYENKYYLFFYPNKESLKLLPHLTERGSELATELFIPNVEFAATELLGSDSAKDLMAGKVKAFSGEVTVMLSGFEAGYECDSPSFIASITKQVKVLKVAENTITVERGGC